MKPFLYAFLTLLVSGCVIYKKHASPTIQQIVNIDSLPFSSSDAKCILIKYLKSNGLAPSYRSYYYFFPEEHIYVHCERKNSPSNPELGYYSFEPQAANGNSYLYLEPATKTSNNIYVENKSIKKSLDSIYLHFKFATIEGLPFNKTNPIYIDNLLDNNKLEVIKNFSVSILIDKPDSSEFIIALKKDKKIKKINFSCSFHTNFEIEEQYNYYEITGATCFVHRTNISAIFRKVSNKYKLQVKPLQGNSYEISNIFANDSSYMYKEIYTWQNVDSLYDYEKEYLYMLPTFIKILECSGTYPRK